MSKIVIEYSEMEKLYSDYVKMENKLGECMGKINELSEILKNTFIAGEASKALSDTVDEKTGSFVGLGRINAKVSDLQLLSSMTKLLIETSTDVMKSLDAKISSQIISDIGNEYGVTHETAASEYERSNAELASTNAMTPEELSNARVKSYLVNGGNG